MIPTQIRAVDPHSSYNSDNVNRITRIITDGVDSVAQDIDLLPSKYSNTSISVTSGVCVKDDVMIQLTDPISAVSSNVAGDYVEGTISTNPYGYIVLTYQYVKTPIPVQAKLQILGIVANYDPTLFLFLGRVNFTTPGVIDTIQLDDPDVSPVLQRSVLNFSSAYTDTQARAADAYNPITNHAASAIGDRNKLVATDAGTGEIVYVSKGSFGLSQVEVLPGDYVGGVATITHNLGVRPVVQCVDYSTGEEIVPATVIHTNENIFTLTFSQFDSTPHIYVLF